jgi:hypothetical protein
MSARKRLRILSCTRAHAQTNKQTTHTHTHMLVRAHTPVWNVGTTIVRFIVKKTVRLYYSCCFSRAMNRSIITTITLYHKRD